MMKDASGQIRFIINALIPHYPPYFSVFLNYLFFEQHSFPLMVAINAICQCQSVNFTPPFPFPLLPIGPILADSLWDGNEWGNEEGINPPLAGGWWLAPGCPGAQQRPPNWECLGPSDWTNNSQVNGFFMGPGMCKKGLLAVVPHFPFPGQLPFLAPFPSVIPSPPKVCTFLPNLCFPFDFFLKSIHFPKQNETSCRKNATQIELHHRPNWGTGKLALSRATKVILGENWA